MKLLWTDLASEDYLHWQDADRNAARRINELIKDARRNPFNGIGKPEPLKGDLAEWWSRRITGEQEVEPGTGGNVVSHRRIPLHPGAQRLSTPSGSCRRSP